MADRLLKILDTTLTSIARAIKSKNGSSSRMTPSQMATAIEALDTYAAATKLTPTNKKLTPSETSYNVPVGVHDGTESVYIELDSSKTVYPSTTQDQPVTPASGKFLSTVLVKGTGSSGYKMDTGTFQSSGGASYTVDSLSFRPKYAMVCLYSTTVSSLTKGPVCTMHINSDLSYSYTGTTMSRRPLSLSAASVELGGSYVTFNSGNSGNEFNGSYRYLIWGVVQ